MKKPKLLERPVDDGLPGLWFALVLIAILAVCVFLAVDIWFLVDEMKEWG